MTADTLHVKILTFNGLDIYEELINNIFINQFHVDAASPAR